MRVLLIFLTTAFLLSCSGKQKVPCSKFHNGSFRIRSANSVAGFVIERTDSIQIETNDRSGVVRKYRVNWKNECEYTLLLMEEEDDERPGLRGRNLFDSISRIPTSTTIISTTDDHYVFSTRKRGFETIYTDTAWVLK